MNEMFTEAARKAIEYARDACGTLEFERADELIALGYEAAMRTLGSL